MYAVIRAGGKQYRVAPGDVIRVEKLNGANGNVEFNDVLAVANEGQVGRPQGNGVKPGRPAPSPRLSGRQEYERAAATAWVP